MRPSAFFKYVLLNSSAYTELRTEPGKDCLNSVRHNQLQLLRYWKYTSRVGNKTDIIVWLINFLVKSSGGHWFNPDYKLNNKEYLS